MKNSKLKLFVIIGLIFTPIFTCSAQGMQRGIHEPGTGIDNPEMKEEMQKTNGTTSVNGQPKTMKVDGMSDPINPTAPTTATGARQGRGEQGVNNANNLAPRRGQVESRANTRRSRVANAVQEMVKFSERNKKVGPQIRTIAQNQARNQELSEGQIAQVKNRGRLKKFFFGPDYKNIKSVEEKIVNHESKVRELKQLAGQITNKTDQVKIQAQIDVMEQVGNELKKETEEQKKGFSLFGWLNRLMNK